MAAGFPYGFALVWMTSSMEQSEGKRQRHWESPIAACLKETLLLNLIDKKLNNPEKQDLIRIIENIRYGFPWGKLR